MIYLHFLSILKKNSSEIGVKTKKLCLFEVFCQHFCSVTNAPAHAQAPRSRSRTRMRDRSRTRTRDGLPQRFDQVFKAFVRAPQPSILRQLQTSITFAYELRFRRSYTRWKALEKCYLSEVVSSPTSFTIKSYDQNTSVVLIFFTINTSKSFKLSIGS